MKNSKLPKFLEAMKIVLEDDRTVILTDMELLTLVNEKLAKKDRVAISTWEAWKTSTTTNPKAPEQTNLDSEIVEEFRHVLGLARVNQKMNLSDKLTDPNSKNAWGASFILERKFDDMKKTQAFAIGQGGITFKIEGGKDTQRLIETIDIDFEEINDDPKQIDNE